MKKILLVFFLAISYSVSAQQEIDLSYYLPQDVTYNEEVPTPMEVLGYVPGQWHVTHDLLLSYMRRLAEASPRISLENRGTTYEGRQLILLTITSEENHQNLEQIRLQHLELLEEGSEDLNTAEMPIVVNQGFSIHGNEASGSNAALLAAYHLAAAQGPEIEELLDNTIILLTLRSTPTVYSVSHIGLTQTGV